MTRQSQPSTMLAAVFDGSLHIDPQRPIPRPRDGEALIQVTLAGVCNTDLEITRGYMPFAGILGHEFVGRVVGGADPTWLGARVVGEINLGCGRCAWCAEGLQRHCPERTVLGIAGKDGAFAEYLTIPVANLCRVPEGMPDETAVFCEPVAAACEIAEQVHLVPGTRALVIGDGKLGLLVAQVLRCLGLEVSVQGRSRRKLALAMQLGAEIVDEADTATPRFPIVVEASGAPEGLAAAIARTQPRGTLVLKSTYAGNTELSTTSVVVDEIQVVGSRCGQFPPALALLSRHPFQTEPLVESCLPLSRAEEGMVLASRSDSLKVLLRPGR